VAHDAALVRQPDVVAAAARWSVVPPGRVLVLVVFLVLVVLVLVVALLLQPASCLPSRPALRPPRALPVRARTPAGGDGRVRVVLVRGLVDDVRAADVDAHVQRAPRGDGGRRRDVASAVRS
jgi:hypothetical protein